MVEDEPGTSAERASDHDWLHEPVPAPPASEHDVPPAPEKSSPAPSAPVPSNPVPPAATSAWPTAPWPAASGWGAAHRDAEETADYPTQRPPQPVDSRPTGEYTASWSGPPPANAGVPQPGMTQPGMTQSHKPFPAGSMSMRSGPSFGGRRARVLTAGVLLLGFLVTGLWWPGFLHRTALDVGAVERGVKQVLSDPENGFGATNVSDVTCNNGTNPIVRSGKSFDCEATVNGAKRHVPVTFADKSGTYWVGSPT